MEYFLLLAVGELNIDHAAEAFHDSQGIELAPSFIVGKLSEVSPIDLELLCRFRLNTQIGFGKHFLPALFS